MENLRPASNPLPSSDAAAARPADEPFTPEDYPDVPCNPRPGTRTLVATTSEHSSWRLKRVGLTLQDAVDEELADYRRGLGDATGVVADAYAYGQPDVTIWEGERCLAVIRPVPGGLPLVTWFDNIGSDVSIPYQDPDHERALAAIIQGRGATYVFRAVGDFFARSLRKSDPERVPFSRLSDAERTVLAVVREIGGQEAIHRLSFSGPYVPPQPDR